MRVLIDECAPRRLRTYLPGHDVRTVPEMGWSGKKNGELLGLMAADGFEVLVTVDQNLRHQQNLAGSGVAVVVLTAATNRLADLVPLMPSALAALATIKPGDTDYRDVAARGRLRLVGAPPQSCGVEDYLAFAQGNSALITGCGRCRGFLSRGSYNSRYGVPRRLFARECGRRRLANPEAAHQPYSAREPLQYRWVDVPWGGIRRASAGGRNDGRPDLLFRLLESVG